jgi:catalase
MPLPSDEKIIALSKELLPQFEILFGQHPGFRPVHAKGVMVAGTFTPSPEASTLTRAPHFARPSTPVVVRFSNSTGIPTMPDNDPNASPHGMAVRFNLAEHVHTDIVAHSTDHFPARTGQEFLEFLPAVAASASSKAKPSPIEQYLSTHPAALAFVAPMACPASFASEPYFAISAFRFLDKAGRARHGRYRILPEAGTARLSDAAAAGKDASYLFEELGHRVAAGPVGFRVVVQVANDGDVVDDATDHWPEARPLVTLGRIALTRLVADSEAEQQRIIFDPIPRVDGIEPSADPLLELRAAIYLLSGRRRRQAPPTQGGSTPTPT